MRTLRFFLWLSLSIALGSCATRAVELTERPALQQAMPAQPDSPFAEIESSIHGAHGPDASGFRLLDRNEDGLRWRLALLDSAKHSIDVQYYVWYGDAAGKILAHRLIEAADRGVKVRMLVDDLNALVSDAQTVTLRDKVAAWMDAHPNIDIRLFNPWKKRDLSARIGEMVSDMERLNHRMHNKAMIADNRAAILGGRNIGDEYLGLHHEFNFHDLDVLGIGSVARQASAVFDLYWNSDWVLPVSALKLETKESDRKAERARLLQNLSDIRSLDQFPIAPQSWSDELAALPARLHAGTSRVLSDVPESRSIRQEMTEVIYDLMATAQKEVLIINAYIIPADRAIKRLSKLTERGVEVKILTNSLASHDVPAVHSHYKKWRKPILEAGAGLWEIRHDAEIQSAVSDTPPTMAEFMGLHSKGMVVDRERVFIGSMNFDPRSAQLNTEMGVIIESPDLGEELAKLIERDILPANSWRVELDDSCGLRWVNDKEAVTSVPARSWWQRVEDVIFMVFPKELY